mmetsp:Transcript_35651/g.105332  ORF Transcript_35651/g.105332 Transcript_35651/m.105332 type:complete len:200 (+) Transcript_35651:1024-1623(+)
MTSSSSISTGDWSSRSADSSSSCEKRGFSHDSAHSTTNTSSYASRVGSSKSHRKSGCVSKCAAISRTCCGCSSSGPVRRRAAYGLADVLLRGTSDGSSDGSRRGSKRSRILARKRNTATMSRKKRLVFLTLCSSKRHVSVCRACGMMSACSSAACAPCVAICSMSVMRLYTCATSVQLKCARVGMPGVLQPIVSSRTKN